VLKTVSLLSKEDSKEITAKLIVQLTKNKLKKAEKLNSNLRQYLK